MKYYNYYKAYEGVLGGMVGKYAIKQETNLEKKNGKALQFEIFFLSQQKDLNIKIMTLSVRPEVMTTKGSVSGMI